ncbi:MAG: T9SS type A sorting domain-containing protein [Bacteroidales bacterium]|jgi:hypothetical protein|nr:T9SS type A sorting domain-containing protein [Bacteroidales bacterium]
MVDIALHAPYQTKRFLSVFLTCLVVLLLNFSAFSQAGGMVAFYQNGTEVDFNDLSAGTTTEVYITVEPQYYLNTAEIIYESGQCDTVNAQIIPVTSVDMRLKYTYQHQTNIQEFCCDFRALQPWSGQQTRPFQEVRVLGADTLRIIFIYTAEDLAWFSDGRPHTEYEVYVMNDLDLNGESESPQNWKPICVEYPFYGSLYGRNKTISNLYVYDTTNNYYSYTALIGQIGDNANPTLIKDWHILNGDIIFENKHNQWTVSGIGSFVGNIIWAAQNVELSNLTNGAALYDNSSAGYGFGLGGIVGSITDMGDYFEARSVKNSINFGKIFPRRGLTIPNSSFIGGVMAKIENTSVSQNINWGSVINSIDSVSYNSFNGIGSGYIYPATAMIRNFNYGRMMYPINRLFFQVDTLVGAGYWPPSAICDNFIYHIAEIGLPIDSVSFYNFSDSILSPDIALFTEGDDTMSGGTFTEHKFYKTNHTLSTYNLIDSAFMAEYLQDANGDFILENGFYPRPRGVDERAGRLSSSPLLLYMGDNVARVTHNFYVDTNYGVRWFSFASDLLTISGDSGILQPAYQNLQKDTTIEIEARFKGFHKNIFLNLHLNSTYIYDTITICENDSTLFFGEWLHEQGEYAHRVISSAPMTTDTFHYLLTLYHSPTYLFEYFDTVVTKNLPYTFHGFYIDTVGIFTFPFTSSLGCDSTYILHISPFICDPSTTYLFEYFDTVVTKNLPYTFHGFYIDTVGIFTFPFTSSLGCDSTYILHIIPFVCNSTIRVPIDSVVPLCSQEFQELEILLASTPQALPYELNFSVAAIAQGFTNRTGIFDRNKIIVPAPLSPYVNRYELYLRFVDTAGCFSQWDTATFEVRYPTTVVKQKWDDVLAVGNSAYNGGYQFTAFQWFENDQLLQGETLFRLYQKPALNEHSTYSVLLTRRDGLTMFSCPITPIKPSGTTVNMEISPNPQKSAGYGYVKLSGKNLKSAYTLSIYHESGIFVHRQTVQQGSNTLDLQLKRGTYILQLHDGTEVIKTVKWIVL